MMNIRILFAFIVILTLIPGVYADEEYHHFLTLDSPDIEANTYFGYSIAVGEDIIVVGEAWRMIEGYYHAGKAYIYDYDGNLKASLQSPTPTVSAVFGGSVAFNGDIIVVGEPLAGVDQIDYSAGKVHIYDVEGNLQSTLTSTEPIHGGRFGYAVAISGDKMIVSESGATFGGYSHAGQVYIFDLEGTLLTTLQSPEPFEGGGSGGNFGYSLDFNGNIIIVGEVHTTVDDKVDAGRVFVFNHNGDLLTSLQSPEPQTEGEFGQSVAVNNDFVIVGEHYAEVEGHDEAGKVHVFDLEGSLLYTLQSPEPEETALFGRKVAASEKIVVVGERGADGSTEDEGRVHLYDMDGNYLTSLKAPQPAATAEFGSFVAVGGDTIAVGERSAVGGEYKAGRVYVFRLGEVIFELSNLIIEPDSVDVGKPITVTVDVENIGTLSGTHTVNLLIDGDLVEEKTVNVDIGASETVSFTYQTDVEGTYRVEIGELEDSFKVSKPIPGFPAVALILGLSLIMIFLTQRKR